MRLRDGTAAHSAVPFPSQAALSLHTLSLTPSAPVAAAADCLRAFRDASAQRDQCAALKLLGGILRKPHGDSGDEECALCALAAPVLAALVLDMPEGPYTITGAALRAAVRGRCRGGAARALVAPFEALMQRLEAASRGAGATERDACDVRAVVAVLGDAECREWMWGRGARLVGAAVVARRMLVTALDDGGSVLSAISALQAVLRAFGAADGAEEMAEIARSVTQQCQRVLAAESVQRRDVMAAAVLLVTSRACCAVLEKGAVLDEGEAKRVSADVFGESVGKVQTRPNVELFLIKAVVESPELAPVRRKLVIDLLLCRLCDICSSSADVSLRFLCGDAIALCLRQLSRGDLPPPMRRRVLNLVDARWDEPYNGIAHQMKETVDAIIALDAVSGGGDQFWADYAVTTLDRFAGSAGMYAPISRIVSHVGADQMLKLRPRVQEAALAVVARKANASKAVAELLETFWVSLLASEASVDSFAERTAAVIILPLTTAYGPDMWQRMATYVLPAYLRVCKGKGHQEKVAQHLLAAAGSLGLPEGDLVRVTVVILGALQSSSCGASPDLSDPQLLALLKAALRSADVEICLGALELLTVSRALSAPMSAEALALVIGALPSLFYPGASAAEFHRLRRALKKMFDRCAGSRGAACNTAGWWDKERKNAGNRDVFESFRTAYISRIDNFYNQLAERLFAYCSPVCASERRRSAIDILVAVVTVAGVDAVLACKGSVEKGRVTCLLKCLTDEWEPTREGALTMLSLAPSAYVGVESVEGANSVLQDASTFLRSPRLSEIEAGASVSQLVFRKAVQRPCAGPGFVTHLGLPGSPSPSTEDSRVGCGSHARTMFFLHAIVDEISTRATGTRSDLSRLSRTGLFVGDTRLLRLCLKDTDWSGLCADSDIGPARVRALLSRMIVELQFSATSALQGLDLNTNGFIDPTADASVILVDDAAQKVATSCYLSVKEICLALGDISRLGSVSGCLAKLPESATLSLRENTSDTVQLLYKDEYERMGRVFDLVLSTVRHSGVLGGACDGYMLLCYSLLSSTDDSVQKLPHKWATAALVSALAGDMYVLRRSAGVPRFVLGALRAEGKIGQHRRGGSGCILTSVMESLLGRLRGAGLIDGISEMISADTAEEIELVAKNDVDGVVHALNILRAVVLDKTIAKEVSRYLSRCTMISLNGFYSSSWLIRNSSFMLFGAVMKRVIVTPVDHAPSQCSSQQTQKRRATAGFDGATEGTSAGVTPSQFFSRFPELHPFLISTLGAKSKSGRNEMAHYPALFLLSSLTPAAESFTVDETLSMKRFDDVVLSHLGARPDCVRQVAALSSVLLIANPKEVVESVEAALKIRVPSSLLTGGQNLLHGELLRLAAILQRWSLSSALTLEHKICVLVEVGSLLQACAWVAFDSSRNPCPVTAAAMLRVMRRCVELAACVALADEGKSHGEASISLYHQVLNTCILASQSCLGPSGFGSDHLAGPVGEPALNRGAAKLACLIWRVRATFDVDANSTFSCSSLLRHPSADVREICARYCADYGPVCGDKLDIWHSLRWLISTETRPRILRDALRCACDILAGETGNDAFNCLDDWDRILYLAQDSPCLNTREVAMCCLGHLVSQLDMESDGLERNHRLSTWSELLERFTHASQAASTRRDAVRSVSASQLLQTGTQSSFVRVAVTRTIVVLIRCLSDEDPAVRFLCCGIVSKAQRGDELTIAFALHKRLPLCESGGLRYAELSLGFSAGSLHSLLGVEFQQTTDVISWKLFGAQGTAIDKSSAQLVDGAEEKLFVEDADNLNAEPDVLVQLCAWRVTEAIQEKSVTCAVETDVVLALLHESVAVLVSLVDASVVNSKQTSVFEPESASAFHNLNKLLCRITCLHCLVQNEISSCARLVQSALDRTCSMSLASTIHPALRSSAAALAETLARKAGDVSGSCYNRVFFLIQS